MKFRKHSSPPPARDRPGSGDRPCDTDLAHQADRYRGGTVAATAVFRADLSGAGIGTLQSITIRDNSFGIGGSTGQFSGFDLDAIILSPAHATRPSVSRLLR